MQNNEYLSLLETEWQKVLGTKDVITPEEKAELRRLLEESKDEVSQEPENHAERTSGSD